MVKLRCLNRCFAMVSVSHRRWWQSLAKILWYLQQPGTKSDKTAIKTAQKQTHQFIMELINKIKLMRSDLFVKWCHFSPITPWIFNISREPTKAPETS